MQITIECLSGSLAGRILRFNQPEIVLGRGEQQKRDVDFLDTDMAVSREHGLVFEQDDRIYYKDQSRGGTLAQGKKIQDATIELQSGDELQLGGKQGPILKVLFRPPTIIDGTASPQMPSASSPAATVLQPGFPPAPPKPTADSTVLQDMDGAEISSTPPPGASPTQIPVEEELEAEVIQTSSDTVFQASDAPTPPPERPTANEETVFQETPSRTPEPVRSEETYFQRPTADPASTIAQGNPSQVENTNATILQESTPARTVPWVPILLGLVAVVGTVGIWFFFLR
jgi:predicted component of type VI protein secretion system